MRIETLAPTVAFLAALLLISEGCRRDGLFEVAGGWMARSAGSRPSRLLAMTFVFGSATTAALNLDAAVLILTPVAIASARLTLIDPRPHVYAVAHLANSASLLMPVSNLTNLLVFHESGLSFAGFTALMALPWLAAVAVDWGGLMLRYRAALREPATDAGSRSAPGSEPARGAGSGAGPDRPVRVAVVLGLTLAGFLLSGPLGVEPLGLALAGAAAITVPDLVRGRLGGRELLRSVRPGLLAFVLVLGLLVDLLGRAGLDERIASALPSGEGYGALLAVAVVAALLSNLVNNLPATLIMAPAVAPLGDGPLLAMLIGVGVGPNLTYLGSLANLLWRRVAERNGVRPELGEFIRLGLLTVPASLVLSTAALWVALRLAG